MIHIPYPIPMPERAHLIAAGVEACRHAPHTPERVEAGAAVRRVLADIQHRYGIDEPEE